MKSKSRLLRAGFPPRIAGVMLAYFIASILTQTGSDWMNGAGWMLGAIAIGYSIYLFNAFHKMSDREFDERMRTQNGGSLSKKRDPRD